MVEQNEQLRSSTYGYSIGADSCTTSVDALNDREIGIELTRAPSEAVI